jgi:two-component system phosphate regulon sensor histidine kinase PhoR
MENAHDGQKLALLVIRDETDSRRMERMRADFLANASHELRTPLASITGFIETLRGPARDDEQARDKFLTIMGAQADRMGRLIADLLSLSRIEMSEHVPPSGETDLPLAVRDVVDSLSVLAQQKGVRLRVDGPKPGLYPIIGDRDQILQVVQNLTDNALKYAPVGSEVTITICFDMTLPQALSLSDKQAAKLILLRPDRNVHDHYARITVRDEGPGIKREFLPRLAERFYRVEGQKSGDRLGTGLGLAIVKHIINRHRGGLVVESQGPVSANEDDILERDGKVATLPTAPQKQNMTFTAFSAYFPQSRAFGSAETPRLVSDSEAPMKDAG